MSFVNTLPYVSNPIEEFSDYKFVSWEKDIYPKFKGNIKKEEQDFFVNLIIKHKEERATASPLDSSEKNLLKYFA